MSIFYKKDLAEFEIGNKKYALAHNPAKNEKDKKNRLTLIKKTEEKLINIQNFKRKYTDMILQNKVSKVINKYKCEKYFTYEIKNEKLSFKREAEIIARDEKYDGFYMVETTNTELSGSEIEKKYKSLQFVERAFDSMKNHIEIRPVFHYKESRIKGHIFSCFMSYFLLHKFKQKTNELLKISTLNNLLTELKCVKKTYFKMDKFYFEKINSLNDTQVKLLKIFQIKAS